MPKRGNAQPCSPPPPARQECRLNVSLTEGGNSKVSQTFIHRLIMPCAQAVVSPPMHSFGLGGERVRDAEITA